VLSHRPIDALASGVVFPTATSESDRPHCPRSGDGYGDQLQLREDAVLAADEQAGAPPGMRSVAQAVVSICAPSKAIAIVQLVRPPDPSVSLELLRRDDRGWPL
jgi:hypothetical protein